MLAIANIAVNEFVNQFSLLMGQLVELNGDSQILEV